MKLASKKNKLLVDENDLQKFLFFRYLMSVRKNQ